MLEFLKTKTVVFLHTNKKISEKETKITMSFIIATVTMKYLGVNLIKELKDI